MANRIMAMLLVFSTIAVAQTPIETQPIGSGWWKVNITKSTYDPGPPPQPSAAPIRYYRLRNDGFWVVSIFGATPTGKPTFTQTVFRLDGQERQSTYTAESLAEFQATGNRPTALSIQKAIDPYTVEIVSKAPDGRVVSTITRSVAKDGKTFKLTTKTTNALGQAVNNVEIYDHIGN